MMKMTQYFMVLSFMKMLLGDWFDVVLYVDNIISNDFSFGVSLTDNYVVYVFSDPFEVVNDNTTNDVSYPHYPSSLLHE